MIRNNNTFLPGGNRQTLNPYRVGLRLILNRLMWDLSPRSFFNRRKLNSIKNKYKGEKAVILCNGPSLNDIDLSSLQGVFTFGLNKINLIFEDTEFRPSCIVSVNPLVLEQNFDFFSSTNIPLFLDRYSNDLGLPEKNNISLLDSCDFPYFSRDCSVSIFQGYTVTYVALQLAYHMGFKEVCLVGCDHNFYKDGIPNKTYNNSTDDISHFSKNYFANGQEWQYPDLLQSEIYYQKAKYVFDNDSRKIVNASTKTNLKTFERVKLDAFLSN